MGNNNSTNNLTPDLIDTSIPINDNIFKVDNINAHGRKHAAAEIQLSNDNLCIKQKHRQSLYIPLETIKRYGLDGSIFILECGRHAPLGQARYAFRCKHARRLVDCLDQRINLRSKQLLEEQRRSTILSASSTLTNVSSSSHHQHHRRRRRTQSDQGLTNRAPSSFRFSSSSSSAVSLTSRTTCSYRNSEPNLSENYLPFDTLPRHVENNDQNEGQFIAKLRQPIEQYIVPDLNYIEFKTETTSIPLDEGSLFIEPEATIATEEPDNESMKSSSVQPSQKQASLSLFNHQQQHKSIKTESNYQNNSSVTAPYVYIDHQKTTTLQEIAHERLQQQQARRIET